LNTGGPSSKSKYLLWTDRVKYREGKSQLRSLENDSERDMLKPGAYKQSREV
jgi:hypothetical protein